MKKFLITILLLVIIMSNSALAMPLDTSIMSTIIAHTQTAKKTDQIILVVDHNLSLWNKTSKGWQIDFETYCGYGKNNFSSDRHAGDKTTPIGSFPILYAFGLVDKPDTSMTYKKITPKSYLSGEAKTYNQWIESDEYIDGEHLIDYYQYKYAMNIGFNIDPVVYGRGSAIFLHCKSHNRWWTSGCVSVVEEDMIKLFQKCHNGVYMIIVPNAEEISSF